MPRLSILIDDLAERFNFEQTKLNSLARAMKEAGQLTTGARGVNAPNATPLDAARLLIAMMLDSKLATVVEDIAIVGRFTALDQSKFTSGFAPANLETGIALVIEFAGSASDELLQDQTMAFELVPYAALAEIYIAKIPEDETVEPRELRLSFTHPDIDPDNLSELPASYHAAAARFPIGFRQRPLVERENLIAIGRLIAGAEQ